MCAVYSASTSATIFADAATLRASRAIRTSFAWQPLGWDPENEGGRIFAAQTATPELLAVMARHTSGYICVGMSADECDLPPMPR